MSSKTFQIDGLTGQQVSESRKRHGRNELSEKREFGFLRSLKDLVIEPMSIGFLSVIWFESVIGVNIQKLT